MQHFDTHEQSSTLHNMRTDVQMSHIPTAKKGFGLWKHANSVNFRVHEESLCVREKKLCHNKPGSTFISRKCTMWCFFFGCPLVCL